MLQTVHAEVVHNDHHILTKCGQHDVLMCVHVCLVTRTTHTQHTHALLHVLLEGIALVSTRFAKLKPHPAAPEEDRSDHRSLLVSA